jgi:hypothetical protein
VVTEPTELDPVLEILGFVYDPSSLDPLDASWEICRSESGGDLRTTAHAFRGRLQELDARLADPDAPDAYGLTADQIAALRSRIASKMPRAAQSIAAEEQIATRAAGQFRASTGGDGVALEDFFPMAARVSTGRPRARQRRDGPGRRRSSSSSSGDSSDSGDPEPGSSSGQPLLFLVDRQYGRVNRALVRFLRTWPP